MLTQCKYYSVLSHEVHYDYILFLKHISVDSGGKIALLIIVSFSLSLSGFSRKPYKGSINIHSIFFKKSRNLSERYIIFLAISSLETFRSFSCLDQLLSRSAAWMSPWGGGTFVLSYVIMLCYINMLF